ncbi:sensor histidine kinase [Clostridium grantii]|uniref:histidine kinase n=1 Tax=Clostridium grantii DSM 8605 TaxID=1121316 RepID=A0A1M5TRH5_9CLOT|nr:histidine kinase N-terminal domain-containing protein [Clostridium grantii]SHH53367.1 Two-component sensor histidine kinase, contains HisKA and HATPase domains [Clostridium grantii DSM 8605]
MLRKLCREHTNLSEEDISILEQLEQSISIMSNLVRKDIFIDCLAKEPDTAIVVAEAKPCNSASLYKNSVVGELALRKNEPAVLRTLEIGMGTTDLKATTQENIMAKQDTEPIKNNEGKIIGVLIMEKDISEDVNQSRNMEILYETTEQLTQTLLNLRDGENENNVAYNLINDGIVIFDENGICMYANYNAEELYSKLGYKDKIIGMKFENLALNEADFNQIVEERKPIAYDTNVSRLSLQIKYGVTQKTSDIYGVIMLIKDITYIKEKEKEIILKAVAIREIHHRVKNNLQTIASILRLQSRRTNSLEVKNSYYESISRILSIATIHEVLAQNGVDDIDIKSILSMIKDNAINNNVNYNNSIKVELLGDSFYVNSDKATSIAIVLNELIQNSLKHAFNNEVEGFIEIKIKKGDMYSTICIIDSGTGFDVNLVKNESLGLNIVKSIVKDKLNGVINIASDKNGTKAVFNFEN